MSSDLLSKASSDVFNLLFGWLKRWNERRIKTSLLWEYEELLKRKAELRKSLEDDASHLEELIDLIAELLGSGFEQRFEGKSAESLANSFDVCKLSKYEDIRRKALEYEKVVFRCFVVRQKLKLYDIDGRLREAES
jgi:hypothetical protein